MNKLKALALYAIDRGKEPSSWAGVAAMLSLAHHSLTSEQAANLALVGVMVAGAAAVIAKG
jgi:hypothetical protein